MTDGVGLHLQQDLITVDEESVTVISFERPYEPGVLVRVMMSGGELATLGSTREEGIIALADYCSELSKKLRLLVP
jgi:hypothetical protein